MSTRVPSLTDLAPIYAMHLPFGLGIFPKMRYSAQIAREAAQRGLTPILHLPMEARNPPDRAPSVTNFLLFTDSLHDTSYTHNVYAKVGQIPERGGVSMRWRIPLALLLVAGMLIGLSGTSPGQNRREIRIALSSFKFEPNLFAVNEGDTVVLQLENIDKQRPHAFNAAYLSQVDFTVTGEGKQDVTKDGTKYVRYEPGEKGEITFVAKGRGQYGFICNLFTHASNGQTGAFIVWPAGYHVKK